MMQEPPPEISIPSTSVVTDPANPNKPYTLYNITLALPMRTYVIQKRYSEFATLHQQLTALVGTPPPAPLPAKSWFRSTVNSPELTEQRRQGLEKYLRAIAEPPDRRWRDTAVWRAFLNLPAAPSSMSVRSLDGGARGFGSMRGVRGEEDFLMASRDPGSWQDVMERMKKALRDARAAVDRRDNLTDNTERIRATNEAVEALSRAGRLAEALGEGLKTLKEVGRIGPGEWRTRLDELNNAKHRRDELDQLVSRAGRTGNPTDKQRATMFDSIPASAPRKQGRVLGGPRQETEETRERDNRGVLQLNQQKLDEQEEYVKDIGVHVRRLRHLGTEIYNAIEQSKDDLDTLDQGLTRLGNGLDKAKALEKKVSGR